MQPPSRFSTFILAHILEKAIAIKETGGKIVYTRYNTTAGTNGGARYALYKHDPDYIEGFLPLPYTPSPLYAQGAFDMISNAMAQFVTPQVKRQNTLIYLDVVS